MALALLVIGASACGPHAGTGDKLDGSTGRDAGDGSTQDASSFWLPDSGPPADAEVCAQSEAVATIESKPVDIIFVIDNSGSMSEEIREVEYQINYNFASIIDSAVPPIDYRVIMLARFGAWSTNRICVAEPLGGIPDADNDGHCDSIPSQPVNTAKFFHHSQSIASHDALCRLLASFTAPDEYGLQPNGYGEVLRPEAFKFIVVVTDDGVSCTPYNDANLVAGGLTVAPAFDSDLLTLSPLHFGASPEERNYSFWSIVSLAPYLATAQKPYGDPHPPDDTLAPIITGECTPSAVDPGTGYQALSIMTGGYRYPTCGLDYTDMFQLMAQGVILGARVACEFGIPEPPEGETLDLETVQVRYLSDGQEVEVFNPAPSLADCSETENQFYIEDDTIKLCPSACALVQADDKAEIKILYGCELNIIVN
jgi:hypothetical protein